jgi:hypothetical protein
MCAKENSVSGALSDGCVSNRGVNRKPYILAWVAGSAFLTIDCRGPQNSIRPVIHAKDEDRIAAMRAAPIIVVAEIQNRRVFSKPQEVVMPSAVNPMVASIPLNLAEISAKVLLTVRGSERSDIQFYSWIWASGNHGGRRLFHASPESIHVLFLKEESGYLHTVGDYPAYDLEIRHRWLPAFLADWRAGYEQGGGLIERVVAVRIKAELETAPTDLSSLPPDRRDWWWCDGELMELTSASFIGRQLDSLCRSLSNPVGRVAACMESAKTVSKN